MPKFYTKAGWLTPYAMACGYIHKTDLTKFQTVKLEQESSSCYSVTFYDLRASDTFKNGRGETLRFGIRVFESFESIADARKLYKKLAGKLQYRYELDAQNCVKRSIII